MRLITLLAYRERGQEHDQGHGRRRDGDEHGREHEGHDRHEDMT